MSRFVVLSLLFLAIGCADEALPPTGGDRDSGPSELGSDAAVDAGPDAGPDDLGLQDSGPPPPKKRVFVTQATFNGNLGGITGGDQKCQTAADDAALDGTWRAWLSTPAENAIQRLADVGPWVLVDRDTQVLANLAAFADGPQVPIRMTASGGFSTTPVWTGTIPDGTTSDRTCQSWTSGFAADSAQVGRSDRADLGWTSTATQTCAGSAALYCFEQ